jgi:predicted DNA-binding WGR domain protein
MGRSYSVLGMAMERRSLQYTDTKSNKFWTIILEGASHTVQYGRVGTTGQSQTKDFGSEAEAHKSFQKLLQEKLKKGYGEVEVVSEIAQVDGKQPAAESQEDPLHSRPAVVLEANQDVVSAILAQLTQNKKALCELAAIDAIPDEYLALLDLEVRVAIAQQSNSAPHILESLVSDTHDQVRQALARNPDLPPRLLEHLAEDKSRNVRLALASNSNTPSSALAKLVDDPYEDIRKKAQAHPNTPKSNKQIIVATTDRALPHERHFFSVLRNIGSQRASDWMGSLRFYRSFYGDKPATDPNTPENILETLAENQEAGMRTAVAQNPSCSESVLRKLADDPYTICHKEYCGIGAWVIRKQVQEAVATNSRTPVDLLEKFIQTQNLFLTLAVAHNPCCPAELLEAIAQEQDFLYPCSEGTPTHQSLYLQDLKLEIAHHPNTPIHVLEALTQYKAPKVTLSHLRHQLQSTSKHVSQAAQANYRYKYASIAKNPDALITQIQKMVKHRDSWVRVIATENSQGLVLLLATYLQKKQSLSRFLAIVHPNLPIATLQDLITSPLWHDRYAITQNPSTPTEILQQLAQDAEPVVQNAAKVALGVKPLAEVSVVQAEVTPASEQLEPAEIEPKNAEQIAVPEKLEIVRSLNLKPEDWLWATWRPRNVLPKENIQSRTYEELEVRLHEVLRQQGNFLEQWKESEIPLVISRLEAHFWLVSMTSGTATSDNCTGEITLTEVCNHIIRWCSRGRGIVPEVMIPISNLVPIVDLLVKLYIEEPDLEYWRIDRIDPNWGIVCSEGGILEGFRQYILPYLSETEIEDLRQQLKPHLKISANSKVSKLYKVASYIGMHEEIQTFVDYLSQQPRGYIDPEYVLGLGSAELVIDKIHRKQTYLRSVQDWRAFLAHTELSALDLIRDYILSISNKSASTFLNETLALVQAPETAPLMLELMLASKASQAARQWLDNHPSLSVVGLLTTAVGEGLEPKALSRSKLSNAAIAFLTSLKRKGYESLIRAALEQQPPEIAEKVKALVLDQEEADLLPFDEKNTPQWLKESIADLPNQKRSQQPDWISAADLPALTVCDRCLSEDQIHACLSALKLSTLDSPVLLVQHLKTHANPQSLDSFIWSLFERWLTEGGSSKEKWAMFALGLLGSDAIALKLTPLIRNWPGENQHPRAVLGLECLRTIGSDTALMQINGIAQKTKYQGLQARAEECMEAIARDRNLTQDQLEDRIIPDCGLNAAGKRSFDFGDRQFHFALSADLKPLVRDEKGKPLTTLPKPNAKDNAERAQQAIVDWKLLKKQVGEIVKIQSVRLEDAMITERRWPWAEFSSLLVQHPLLNHLVQRLIWGTYSPKGTLTQTFRVSEDRTYADCSDDAFTPDESALVGIIHPIDLSEDLTAQWGQTLSDYEIIPPFAQINREVYRLHPEETEAEEILRFKDIPIPGEILAYTMEKFGWQRGGLHDHGDYRVHYKDFDQGKVTAIVGDYECQHVEKSSIWGSDAIDGCLFLVDVIREPSAYPAPGSWDERQMKAKRLRLGEVHPLVISEVLRDLTAIATAAQTQ